MGRKKDRVDVRNQQTYLMYYTKLVNYALSLFEWKGLPESINKRFLELTMLKNGNAVFFKDPQLGYLATQVMTTGIMNFYNEPQKFKAWGINYEKDLTPDDGVIIWNNYARTPIMPVIEQYAERLYRVERTIDVNVNFQKFPALILVEESQRLTMLNAMEQFDGFHPLIYGNKSGFDKDAIQAIQTGIPYVIDKLTDYKHDLWNDAMTFLGLGNANQDKKERLVADEVSANDEQIEGAREVMLAARQDACEQINRLFPDLNISVDFKIKNAEPQEEEGEEND